MHTPNRTLRSTACRIVAMMGLFASSLGASAHDFWIEPSTFTPQPGQAVQLRLLVGEKLHGDPVRRPAADGFRQFSIDDGTRRPIGGRAGADPAGLTRVAGSGVQIVVFHGLPIPIEIEAEKFNAYLLEEGLEAVVEARKAKGQLGSLGREIYSRNAKSLLRVGEGGAADSAGDRALGLPLELVADRNPYRLRPGDELPLRLLYQGKPLAGALVVAQHRQQPALSRSARSDGQGRVSLALGTSGLWLIKAVHMIPAADPAVADWESLWASLTFELPAAP